jgi:hypothetical protein
MEAQSAQEGYLRFPAVVGLRSKVGMKVKKEGKTKYDLDWDKGKLGYDRKEICHCFLNQKEFYAEEFNKQISKGIGIVPGVGIPISKKIEQGQAFVHFQLSEIKDFRPVESTLTKRLGINTFNQLIDLRPVDFTNIDQARHNRKLIKAAQEVYESIGINSKEGPGFMSNYDRPFIDFFHNCLNQYTTQGFVTKKVNATAKVCPKHKRTGEYVPMYNAYLCRSCNDYIK